MNSLTRHTLEITALFCLLATTLQGCGPMNQMVMVIDEKYGGGNYKRTLEHRDYLTTERDKLQAQYDAYVKEADDYIATMKPQIEAHIEAGEIGPALVKLTNMDNTLHPTEGYEPQQGLRKVVQHSGRTQRDYIRDAAKRTLAKVDGVMASGKFQKLDGWLGKHTNLQTMDEATRKGFEQKQTQLNQSWLAVLLESSDRTESSHPGSALVYALKGQALAIDLGDEQALAKLQSRIKSLNASLTDAHGYVFTIGNASGSHAADVVKRITRSTWGVTRIRHQSTQNARVDGTLTFSIDEPRYSRSTSQTSGSFRYKSGTKQVPNPAYESAQNDIERAQSNVEDKQNDLNNMRRDTQGWENTQRDRQNKLASAREDLSRAQSRLSGIPKTVTKDVFDDYTYPITVHELRTSWNLDANIAASTGAVPLEGNVASFLTDNEHDSYSKNDGSVSADPANPPSKPKGLANLKGHTAKELRGAITKSFLIYQKSLLDALPESGEDRINQLAIHAFLDPGSADPQAMQQLEELADMNGLTKLLEANKQ